jgi:uncharacterized membrane protein HdeD (DUF308 family)
MTTVRGMGTIAAKYWWVILVRGIILVLLGIAMFAWPQATLTVFVWFFAAYLFVDGIMSIVQGFSERKDGQPSGWSFAQGILAIAFGIAVLAWPDTIGKVLMIVIGIWAILAGIAGIAAGFRMKQVPGSGWGWFLAWGILALVFGIALIANPAAGILSILRLVALWAVMAGVVFIAASFFVRKLGNTIVNSPEL